MRTIKEVAALSGISVRTLQYYDEIGVFKPTKVTDAGYRLYDDEALNTLQQILFFKELDFKLKDIKQIMETPDYDKLKAFKNQRKLLKAKRDRLDRLLALLEKLEKGETCMSFQEFDLSEYIKVLEQFKTENEEEVIQYWGSVQAFDDQFIKRAKENGASIAETAVKFYGSIEKYVESVKNNLSHFSENMDKMEEIKAGGYIEKNQELTQQLLADVTKDPRSEEVQNMVQALMDLAKETQPEHMDLGENYYSILMEGYLHDPKIIEAMDKRYGPGASKFMGEALQAYFKQH
ncbi:MAG: MerR family transcriptional regulator [Blautia sp.]|jgi:DNA-binding transcriptional MerR regulator